MKPPDDRPGGDWRRLVEEYRHEADAAARSLTSPLIDEDDRRSIALLALCEAAPGWRGDGPFGAFAHAVSRRAILCELRRLRRRPPVAHLGDRDRLVRGGDAPPGLDARDMADMLRRRIASLNPREREAIELYASGLRWADVARAMGIRDTSVERLRREASAKVRAELRD